MKCSLIIIAYYIAVPALARDPGYMHGNVYQRQALQKRGGGSPKQNEKIPNPDKTLPSRLSNTDLLKHASSVSLRPPEGSRPSREVKASVQAIGPAVIGGLTNDQRIRRPLVQTIPAGTMSAPWEFRHHTLAIAGGKTKVPSFPTEGTSSSQAPKVLQAPSSGKAPHPLPASSPANLPPRLQSPARFAAEATAQGPTGYARLTVPEGGRGEVTIKTPNNPARDFTVSSGEEKFFRGSTTHATDADIKARVTQGGRVAAWAYGQPNPRFHHEFVGEVPDGHS